MKTKRTPIARVEKPDLKPATAKQGQTKTGVPVRKCNHDWVFVGTVGDAHCHKCNNWMNID